MKTSLLSIVLWSILVGAVAAQDGRKKELIVGPPAGESIVGIWVQFLEGSHPDNWIDGARCRVAFESGRSRMTIESVPESEPGLVTSVTLSNVEFDGKTWKFDSTSAEGQVAHFTLHRVNDDLFEGEAGDGNRWKNRNLWMRVGHPPTDGESRRGSIDIEEVTCETRKRFSTPELDEVVWWIPPEWLGAQLDFDEPVLKRVRAELLRTIGPYTIIAVADGRPLAAKDGTGPREGFEYRSASEIRKSLTLRSPGGGELHPVAENEFDPRVTESVETLARPLSGLPDTTQRNLHFFYFRAQGKLREPIVSMSGEGSFSVELDDRHFVWHLPLSSVVPSRTCPDCKEVLSGGYRFCPWDGTKLTPAAGK